MDTRNSRNGVQRNLFGTAPNDHSKTQDDIRQEMEQLAWEKSQKWNFDFQNYTPLPPGRYKWERVGKRLQTRASPPHDKNSTTDESSCSRTSEIKPRKRPHYNLRNREPETPELKPTEKYLRPIEAANPRKHWTELATDKLSKPVAKSVDNTTRIPSHLT